MVRAIENEHALRGRRAAGFLAVAEGHSGDVALHSARLDRGQLIRVSSMGHSSRRGDHGSRSASKPDAAATTWSISFRGVGSRTFANTPSLRSTAPSDADSRWESQRSTPRVGTATTSAANGRVAAFEAPHGRLQANRRSHLPIRAELRGWPAHRRSLRGRHRRQQRLLHRPTMNPAPDRQPTDREAFPITVLSNLLERLHLDPIPSGTFRSSSIKLKQSAAVGRRWGQFRSSFPYSGRLARMPPRSPPAQEYARAGDSRHLLIGVETCEEVGGRDDRRPRTFQAREVAIA
jgi:hypothetical protein